MKYIFLILICFIGIAGYSQPIQNRANASITVQDQRGRFPLNLFVPIYKDTVAANVQKGIDSIGAIIFTRDSNALWYRTNQKGWRLISSGGGGTIGVFVDSVTVSGNTICQWIQGVPKCYTISQTPPNPAVGVDSLTYSGNSICYWISGVPTCYNIIGQGIDSVTIEPIGGGDSSLFCQWAQGVATCYTIVGNNLGTGIDSIVVHGDTICQWTSGVSICYQINNIGKDYQTVILNHDSTWYYGQNIGITIDSFPTLAPTIVGYNRIYLRDSLNRVYIGWDSTGFSGGGGGTVVGARNGDSLVNGYVELGGLMTKSDTITTSNNRLLVTGGGNINGVLGINNTSAGASSGLKITMTGSGSAITTNGVIATTGGFSGSTVSGPTASLTSSQGLALNAISGSTNTNTVENILTMTRRVDGGNGANGVGGAIDISLERTDGVDAPAARLITRYLDATSGSKLTQFQILGYSGALTDTLISLNGDGAAKLNMYTGSTFQTTDTTTYKPTVMDASGNIRKATYWIGGGSGSTGGRFVTNGLYTFVDSTSSLYTVRADTTVATGLSGKYKRIADSVLNPGYTTLYQYNKGKDSLQTNVNSKSDTTALYGVLYNKNSWATLGDFTNNGSTSSVVANKIQISGGAGTFTQSLDLNGYTCLEKWRMTAKVLTATKTGTSYGVGLGIRSSNSYGLSNSLGRFDLSSNGTSGQLILNTGTSNTGVGTSTTNATFTAGDYILISVERNVDSLIMTASNYTTKGVLSRVAYQWDLNTATYIHNTGHFAIYSLGGTFTIDSLVVESLETKNSPLMVIGDSKVQGYNAGAFYQRFGYLLGQIYTPTVISGGGFDRISDVKDRISEIIALAPKNVVMEIGSNSIRSGVSAATYEADYQIIVDSLHNRGIKVWHTDLLYETSISQAVLINWIAATFSADSIIHTYWPMSTSSSFLSADNVHPTTLGNINVFKSIVSSSKIGKGNKIYDYMKGYQTALIGNPFLQGGNTLTAGSSTLGSTNNVSLPFITNNTVKAVLDSNGRFGLGTSSPAVLLDINANGLGNDQFRIKNTTAASRTVLTFDNGTQLGIVGINGTAQAPYSIMYSKRAFLYGSGGVAIVADVSTPIVFAAGGSAPTEKARFDSVTGNFGIGVTSPTALLHLAAATATAGTGQLKFNSSTLPTTPETGLINFKTGLWYGDSSNSVRDTFAMRQWVRYNFATLSSALTSANFVYNEEFTGSTSATYTLANTPVSGKLEVFKNGVKLPNSEFSLSTATVTLVSGRLSGDIISNNYIK